MAKYLAIFTGTATDGERESISPQESSAFVDRGGMSASAVGEALIDPGAPLYRTIRLTAVAAVSFEDSKTAYAIAVAASHDEAVEVFAIHPHLDLMPGNSIEVFECPAPTISVE